MTALAEDIRPHDDIAVVQDARGKSYSASDLTKSGISPDALAGSRVAISLRDPVSVVRALIALDGQVDAILLLSHALPVETALELARGAGCTDFVTDHLAQQANGIPTLSLEAALGSFRREEPLATQWLMTTSGTTGLPKIVSHTLRSLARSVYRFDAKPGEALPSWGLLYDPTRFAGVQVVLQALMGGGSLVVVDTSKPLREQVEALAAKGCTHLSATPTLWRRLLMVPGHEALQLRQITLGGEIADQSILDALQRAYPGARISHIYASTEAGVGFSVKDGLAGFPEGYLERAPGDVRLKIRDDILWLAPPSSASASGLPKDDVDEDGFIRSGDRVALQGERVVFLGRENGMINVGGVKVYPETVEAVAKTVPGVALVRVFGKASPVTGALVVAEVQVDADADPKVVRKQIQDTCRDQLGREAVPAFVRFVNDFKVNAAGKLVRTEG